EVWVGTSFIANALAPVAPIPVVRIPPVLTLRGRGSPQAGRARLGLAADEWLYLFVFDFHSYFERKNPLAVVEAFKWAFPPAGRPPLGGQWRQPASQPGRVPDAARARRRPSDLDPGRLLERR